MSCEIAVGHPSYHPLCPACLSSCEELFNFWHCHLYICLKHCGKSHLPLLLALGVVNPLYLAVVGGFN